MDLEDLQTSLLGRQINRDVTVEPAWPKQGRVEHVGGLVAARTMTLSLGEKPSISVKIWFRVCSRSS